jgi:hypothetical protein
MPFRFASDIEGRLAALEFEAGSCLNALEQRVRKLEAQFTRETATLTGEDRAHGIVANEPVRLEEIRSPGGLTPRPRFDRKGNHRRYMREWRRRRAALRKP